MRRPGTIRLALMGGGVLLAAGGGVALLGRDSEACRQARAANLPEAAELCRSSGRGSSSGHSSGSWFGHSSGSGGTGTAAAAAAAVSRGGFGGSAHASGS